MKDIKDIIDDLTKESMMVLNNYNKEKNIKKFIKALINKKIYTKDLIFWPNALLIYSLLLVHNDKTKEVVDRQFKKFKKTNYKIKNNDDALMIYLFLKYKNYFENHEIKKIEKKMMNKIRCYYNNVIPYRNDDKNEIFIDLLGMVPPFLCLYGINNSDDKIVDWAIMQYKQFLKYGFDTDTKLPFHSYNKITNDKNGIVGWSRSLGWIMFGLSESIECLFNANNSKYKILLNIYELILKKVLSYIRTDGGYSWQIITKEGHLDTSGTSMILLSILTLKKQKIIKDEYNHVIEKNIKCLELNIENGKVNSCSAECLGIGLYPQKYSSYAWSVGPTLSCLVIYNKIMERK